MIAPVVLEGFRVALVSPEPGLIFREGTEVSSTLRASAARRRRKLSLRRRLWGLVLPPWPKDD